MAVDIDRPGEAWPLGPVRYKSACRVSVVEEQTGAPNDVQRRADVPAELGLEIVLPLVLEAPGADHVRSACPRAIQTRECALDRDAARRRWKLGRATVT